MRTAAALLLVLITTPAYGQPAAGYDASFTSRTMRVGCFHTGGRVRTVFENGALFFFAILCSL